MSRTSLARTIWHRIETINAVTYFSPECAQAQEALGLKGYWMGYFACRAAPMGAVGPGVVEATFCNFHPARVRRAVPDAWSYADPASVLDARAAAAAAALRRLLGDAAEPTAVAALPLLRAAIDRGNAAGRPLFAANRDVAEPDDPVARLWQACTTLREHRGDGHVALLAGAGLDGCEVHVLFAGDDGDPDLYLRSRGWSAEDWTAAADRLAARGAGPGLRDEIERRTDELAIEAYRDVDTDALLGALTPAAQTIAAAGEIMFPNPMGLPPS